MAYESEGLPGIYKEQARQRAIANAPGGIRRNRERITELEERVAKLEKAKEKPK